MKLEVPQQVSLTLWEDETIRITGTRITKTDEDNTEILEGDVLAHSPHRDEIMALLGDGLAPDVAVEWCGEPDDSRVVAI